MRFRFANADGETKVDWVILAALVGSLAVNVYLGASRAHSPGPTASSAAQFLPVGSEAPAFEAHDLQGRTVSVKFNADDRDTLLYAFSPTCHWCERNRANIQAILKSRPDLHIVGVALSGDAKQLMSADNPFTTTLRPTAATVNAFGLRATPTTILISAQGKVLKEWPGAYTGPIAVDIARVLAVSLPGLLDQ